MFFKISVYIVIFGALVAIYDLSLGAPKSFVPFLGMWFIFSALFGLFVIVRKLVRLVSSAMKKSQPAKSTKNAPTESQPAKKQVAASNIAYLKKPVSTSAPQKQKSEQKPEIKAMFLLAIVIYTVIAFIMAIASENDTPHLIGFTIAIVAIIELVKSMMKDDNMKARNEFRKALVGNGFKIKTAIPLEEYDLFFDTENKQWAISTRGKIFKFSDVNNVGLIRNGETVADWSLTRAALGGMLFGGTGAIVGAATADKKENITNLQVKVSVNDFENPTVYIDCMSKGSPETSFETAQKILSLFEIVLKG